MVYITYTMATRDLPDIYALALGLGHIYIYQANPLWPWYNQEYIIIEEGGECLTAIDSPNAQRSDITQSSIATKGDKLRCYLDYRRCPLK